MHHHRYLYFHPYLLPAHTIDRSHRESNQRFLIYSEKGLQTPSFQITPDKTAIAVAERTLPQINLYDSRMFRKLKSITFHIENQQLQDILFMSISNDSKWIALIVHEPCVQVLYANMEKGKVLAHEKLNMSDEELVTLQLNPFDSTTTAVVDRTHLKFMKYNDGNYITRSMTSTVCLI